MFGSGPKLWSKAEKRQALAFQDFARRKAEIYNRQAGQAIDKSFGDALAQSQRGAERARANIMQMNQAGLGGAMSSAIGRGLGGTTVQDNMARMVRSDSAQQMGALEGALADRYGSIAAARGQAKAGTLGQLAQMYPQFAEMKTATLQAPTKSKSNLFGSLLGAVGGQFLGALTGSLGNNLGDSLIKPPSNDFFSMFVNKDK